MPGVNEVRLIGNVTREVELRHIGSGTAVTDIGVAVTERVKKNNEWVEETEFVEVTLWGRLAEVAAEYLTKGSQIYIAGRLKLDRWEKDGKQYTKLKVIGDKMQMLGGRPKNQDSQERAPAKQEFNQQPPPDEIPFVLLWLLLSVAMGGMLG